MEIIEPRTSSHYAFGPPWLFRGSALYQLHLVKAEIARAFIPKELKLVEAFGYTLGGFFLAHYDDSPAGIFDELVVISGIVWNPPTSCAWAARVLVSSQEACKHGRKEVGLPSQVAMFAERSTRNFDKPITKSSGFLNILRSGSTLHNSNEHTEIQVTEVNDFSTAVLCNITLPFAVAGSQSKMWTGPSIRMSLPSFSGKTKHNPNLLKYSCQIECRLQRVQPAKISGPVKDNHHRSLEEQKSEEGEMGGLPGKCDSCYQEEQKFEVGKIDGLSADHDAWHRCVSVLHSKPILALKFNFLKMEVQAPTVVIPDSEKDGNKF